MLSPCLPRFRAAPTPCPARHKEPTVPKPELNLSRRAFGGAVGAGAAAAVVGPPASVARAAPTASGATAERPFRAATGRRAKRPNLLGILADDLGWADLACYGSPHIKTPPHLDRLASQGVRFTDGCAGSSTCSPTRLSLCTGRDPGRTEAGLEEPIIERSAVGLEPAHPTPASLLGRAGYRTAMIGKWHCGFLPDHSPTRSGWDEFFGNVGGALEYYSKLTSDRGYDLYEGETPYRDLRHYTRVLTERAGEFVARDHDRVPTILRWPARVDGHQVSRVPVFTPDWTATFLAGPLPAHPRGAGPAPRPVEVPPCRQGQVPAQGRQGLALRPGAGPAGVWRAGGARHAPGGRA
ncbi:sulfatase-like hydrolase/transferase, partial [Streptomyces griseus]